MNNDPEVRKKENDRIDRFIFRYLLLDGVFILRLIGHNTNNITATEIIVAVWKNWNEIQDKGSNIQDNDNNEDPFPLKSAPPLDDDESEKKYPPLDDLDGDPRTSNYLAGESDPLTRDIS